MLSGFEDQPAPAVANDFTGDNELEVAVTQRVVNLGEDSLQGSIKGRG